MAATKARISKEEFEKGYYDYKGIRYHMFTTSPASLDAMTTFEVRPDDIFLITFPKCGTHWASEIINLILTGGDPDKIDHARQECALEMKSPRTHQPWHETLTAMTGRRVILTHLPEFLLPPQVFTKKAKVIYVTRNPKDCGSSMYHILNGIGIEGTWDEFAEKWIKQEKVGNGGFFNHVLSYWKHRHESSVLYMKFEDMKKDPRGSIIRFADHLECALTDKELDDVVYHSEIKNMKKTYEKVEKKTPDGVFLTRAMGKYGFIRKGQIGDWKNHFTVAQNERFDAVIQQNLFGTGLIFDFE